MSNSWIKIYCSQNSPNSSFHFFCGCLHETMSDRILRVFSIVSCSCSRIFRWARRCHTTVANNILSTNLAHLITKNIISESFSESCNPCCRGISQPGTRYSRDREDLYRVRTRAKEDTACIGLKFVAYFCLFGCHWLRLSQCPK